MKLIKKILKILGALILVIVLLVFGFFWRDSVSDKYNITIADSKIPLFKEITIDFNHQYNGEKSLPFTPSALIDIDNDKIDKVFFQLRNI